jgi:hypothetical protein
LNNIILNKSQKNVMVYVGYMFSLSKDGLQTSLKNFLSNLFTVVNNIGISFIIFHKYFCDELCDELQNIQKEEDKSTRDFLSKFMCIF